MISYSFYHTDDRIRRHVSSLRSDGYGVDLICLRYPGVSSNYDDNDFKVFLPRHRRYNVSMMRVFIEYILFALSSAWILLRNHLFFHRYKLVHVNNMPNFLVFSALPLKWLGVPILLDIHDTMAEIYQDRRNSDEKSIVIRLMLLEERISMQVAHYVITTEHTKWRRLIANGLSASKSCVVLNVPDPQIWPSPEISAAAVQKKDTFRLVYHGTFAYRLGLDIAIRAVHKIRDHVPGIRLDLIGDGDERPNLVKLVKELGLEEIVHLSEGFVSVDQLPDLIAGSDLAVLPSRNSVATKYMLPGKLLEYARFGIPAICVPTPTITFYFNESQVAFVPSEDVDALAQKIEYLYNHPEERLRMACEARKFFDECSFEMVRERYLNVVNQMITNHGTVNSLPMGSLDRKTLV